MKTATSFSLVDGLIFVDSVVVGPLGRAKAQLALDTGAARTTLVPSIAIAIGCDRSTSIIPTAIRTAAAVERGYLSALVAISSLGFTMRPLEVNVADLGYDIDGLLGVDFLFHFNVEIRPAERRILVEKIAAG